MTKLILVWAGHTGIIVGFVVRWLKRNAKFNKRVATDLGIVNSKIPGRGWDAYT